MASMYDEADEAPAAPMDNKDEGMEEKDPSGGKTALINSDICPGMKVGDTIMLDIVAIHDGEYEVKYNTEPESKSPDSNEEAMEGPGGSEGSGNPGMGNYD